MQKKLYAVSINLSRDSKWDYEECHLIMAENADEAKKIIKEDREEEHYEGWYRYEVVEVDMEALIRGEWQRVYGYYHN